MPRPEEAKIIPRDTHVRAVPSLAPQGSSPLVGGGPGAVFKTDVTEHLVQAGSIPVRLRCQERHALSCECGARARSGSPAHCPAAAERVRVLTAPAAT